VFLMKKQTKKKKKDHSKVCFIKIGKEERVVYSSKEKSAKKREEGFNITSVPEGRGKRRNPIFSYGKGMKKRKKTTKAA